MPVVIEMPALSPTMKSGTLLSWHKKEGESVAIGDLLAEVETDKATMEVEAFDAGVLARIYVPAGTEDVPVNTVIAIIAQEGEDVSSYTPPAALSNSDPQEEKGASVQPSSPSKVEEPVCSGIEKTSSDCIGQQHEERVWASPLARRIAAQKGIDIRTIKGTGPRGRIIVRDINTSDTSIVPLSSMRRVIAERLLYSKQNIPHFYLNDDVIMDKLLQVRSGLKESGHAFTINDFFIRAVALALRDVPAVNATWHDKGIEYYKHAHIAVAVAIDGGLVTPVIRNADTKSLHRLSEESKTLIQKAHDRKLRPQDMEKGSFSISNLGMYGICSFTAIVNPPQAAILAIGASQEKVISQDGVIRSAHVCTLTLSCDHRIVDGKDGAVFLTSIKSYLENPYQLLVEDM